MAMNPMQQMLMQAQKMQRDMKKAMDALNEKEYTVSKSGMVEITMKGDFTVTKLNIDKDALDPDNAEMLTETLSLAIGECLKQINDDKNAIEEKITGQTGFPF